MATRDEPDPAERLICVECGREQTVGERGWRAYLTTDEDEQAEAIVYCPDCATREFGRRGAHGRA
jgi:DNA-directed RNA polymerase subunit RPC12/RpoP